MKDFIASLMSEKDYKEMCRKYLRDKSEADDQIIYKDNFLYDQAYDAICLLIDIGTVSNSSDIERVLNDVNKHILRKFREKFKRKPLVPGNKANWKIYNYLGDICWWFELLFGVLSRLTNKLISK